MRIRTLRSPVSRCSGSFGYRSNWLAPHGLLPCSERIHGTLERLIIGRLISVIRWCSFTHGRCCANRWLLRHGLLIALCFAVLQGVSAAQEPRSVRLRLLWGTGVAEGQPIEGEVRVEGGEFSNLQALGMLPDEAAAVRLIDNRVVLRPLSARRFDGCDLTVRGNDQTKILVRINEAGEELSATLDDLTKQPWRQSLGEGKGSLIVQRAPGDRMRVQVDRDSMVFNPNEEWSCLVSPQLPATQASRRLELVAQVRRIGSGDVLWQSKVAFQKAEGTGTEIALSCPSEEGAYALRLAVVEPAGFAKRFLPGAKQTAVLERTVEFVVIDSEQPLPRISMTGPKELTIDPTNPRWWQRLPGWAQAEWAAQVKLPGVTGPQPLGNVKLEISKTGDGQVAALPAMGEDQEAPWQAYTLPIRHVGMPHAIEIQLPQGRGQRLSVSVIEPDATGRVDTVLRSVDYYQTPADNAGETTLESQRFVFWPRTAAPVLLLANRSPQSKAEFGKITLRRLDVTAQTKTSPQARSAERLVTAYLSQPLLAELFGAQQQADASTGLSTDSWQTHLEAAQRLAQQLHAHGFNAAVLTVAAEGSSLTPALALGDSPRYASGRLTSADPMPKDVLEALLRVFDREGLKLTPAIALTAPLPALEQQVAGEGQPTDGVLLVGPSGKTWHQTHPSLAGLGPRYNLLNPRVQQTLEEHLVALCNRYAGHPSLGGVAVQLSSEGYAMLPGLAWGVDDATVGRFLQEVSVREPDFGSNRLAGRSQWLSTEQRSSWSTWRQTIVADFYARLARSLQTTRADLKLTLCTEDLFAGSEMEAAVERAAAGRTTTVAELADAGIDLQRLANTEGITLWRPARTHTSHSGQQQALSMHVNRATDLDRAFGLGEASKKTYAAVLVSHQADRLRVPSFDRRGPFGNNKSALEMQAATLPVGGIAQRELAAALAKSDPSELALSASPALLSMGSSTRQLLTSIGQLPPPTAEVVTQQRQPLTLRVYRHEGATYLSLVNNSPWACEATLPFDCETELNYQRLGRAPEDPANTSSLPTEGSLKPGHQQWGLSLQPYNIVAWRIDGVGLRVGAMDVVLEQEALAVLAARLQDIEQRMKRLNIRRTYPGLESDGFEQPEQRSPAGGLPWQFRLGRLGNVDYQGQPHAGERSLRLTSKDQLGVAAESNAFAVPNTGRLALSAWYRAERAGPNTRLHLSVEYQVPGGVRRLHKTLGGNVPLSSEWAQCEFVVEEIAAEEQGQMRVQFHLTGQGQVLVDEVQLYDLQFDRQTRIDLAKQVYAARTALAQQRVTDCLQLIDGYWPRYLSANVRLPEEESAAQQLAAETRDQGPVTRSEPEGSPRLTERLRQWTPRLWR